MAVTRAQGWDTPDWDTQDWDMQDWDMTATAPAPRFALDVPRGRSVALWLAAAVATALILLSAAGGPVAHLLAGSVSPPNGLATPLAHLAAPGVTRPSLLVMAHALAVLAGCYALLRIAARLAAPDPGGLTAAALLIGLVWLASAPGLVSGVPSLGDVFSPTQTGIALLLLALALLLDGAPRIAIAMLGLVFDAQPEMALWGAVVLAGASMPLWRAGTPVARFWLAGAAGALLLALPGLLWWLHGGAPLPVSTDAVDGLLPLPAWAPSTVPMANWVLSACMIVLGLASFGVLGPDGLPAFGAFVAAALVFAAGCALPLVTSDPYWLALRPVAADTVVQLLAAGAAAAVVARDLRSTGSALRVGLSILVAAGLLLHQFLLPLATLAMLARAAAAQGELLGIERRIRDCDRATLHRIGLSLVALAALAGCVLQGL